jgi:hypothetical protein
MEQNRVLPKRHGHAVIKLICLASLLMCGGCIESFLIFPSTQPIAFAHAQPRMISVHNQKIEVLVTRSPALMNGEAPGGYVLEFTGNASRAEDVIDESRRRWSELPVEIWVMNYPGFGKSDGPCTVKSIPSIVVSTCDELRRIAGPKPVFVSGRSFGTIAALYVASQRKVAGVVLESGPPFEQLIQGEYGWWNLWLLSSIGVSQIPVELESLKTAAKVKAPGIFILTGQDAIVPMKYQQMVLSAYAGPKFTVQLPNASHNVNLPPFDQIDDFHHKLKLIWNQVGNK